MKKILLRALTDPQVPELEVRTVDVIRQVIRTPLDKQRGADIEEIRRGIRILDAVDKADGVLELEDADWEHLKAKTLSMTWAVVDKRLLRIVDDVVDASDELVLNDLQDGRVIAA